jgi:hypothetical protein
MFEQRKILEDVIKRHEDYSFRIKGWFAAVAGGLAAALHVYNVHFTAWWEFLIFLIVITVGFAVWLTYHRIIVSRAIERAQEIERKSSHDTTDVERENLLEISKWLSRPICFCDWRRGFFQNPVVWIPTVIGIVLLALIWSSAPEASNQGTAPPGISNQSTGGPGSTCTGSSPPNRSSSTCNQNTCVPSNGESENTCAKPSEGDEKGHTSAGPSWIPLLTVFVIATGGGCLLLLLGHGFFPKGLGIATVGLGLLTGWQLAFVKEAKVESIFTLKDSVKDLHLTVNWGTVKPPPGQPLQTTFGARYLGSVKKFRVGGTSIISVDFESDADFQGDLRKICEGWQKLADPYNALVTIIGHTDRLRLRGLTEKRYETNTGLGLSRAAEVKDWLAGNCWNNPAYAPDQDKVVLLGAGPLSTPPISPKTNITDGKSGGFPSDRRVDVYALATAPVPAITPAGEAIADREKSAMKKHAATQPESFIDGLFSFINGLPSLFANTWAGGGAIAEAVPITANAA